MSNLTIKQLSAIAGAPSDQEGRAAFGIKWFDSEEKANAYAEIVRREGRTYNGGYFHGMSCGRDESFDYVVNEQCTDEDKCPVWRKRCLLPRTLLGVKLYAVTN
jgi:hypothetical protein